MKKENINNKIVRLTELAILTAIIIIMAFTPVGYLKILTVGIEITFITIPVIIGAIILGARVGALLGFVFGITSFLQAALGLSPFGVLMMEVSPFFCFLVCVPTRTLMGLLTGLLSKAFKKDDAFGASITSFAGSIFNTILFMGTFVACFWNANFVIALREAKGASNIFTFILFFVGMNGMIEAIACTIIASAIVIAIRKYIK